MPLIEGHYTVDGFYEAIDDILEEAEREWMSNLMASENSGSVLRPIEEDDVLPF